MGKREKPVRPRHGERVRIAAKWSLHHRQIGVVIDGYHGLDVVAFDDGHVAAFDHVYEEMEVCDVEA